MSLRIAELLAVTVFIAILVNLIYPSLIIANAETNVSIRRMASTNVCDNGFRTLEMTLDTVHFPNNPKSGQTLTLTLWWNGVIYTTMFIPNTNGPFVFNLNDLTVIGSDCIGLYQLLIQNPSSGAAAFDTITIFAGTTFYGSMAYCGDPAILGGTYATNLVFTPPPSVACGSDTQYHSICIDNNNCVPTDLLIEFDNAQPDVLIDNALISDGSGITPVDDGCCNENFYCCSLDDCCDSLACKANQCEACTGFGEECLSTDQCCDIDDNPMSLQMVTCGANQLYSNNSNICCLTNGACGCKSDSTCCGDLVCNDNGLCQTCRSLYGSCTQNCDCCNEGGIDGDIVCRQDENNLFNYICQECVRKNNTCIEDNDCCNTDSYNNQLICNGISNTCNVCGYESNTGKGKEIECFDDTDCCADLQCDKKKCKKPKKKSSSSSKKSSSMKYAARNMYNNLYEDSIDNNNDDYYKNMNENQSNNRNNITISIPPIASIIIVIILLSIILINYLYSDLCKFNQQQNEIINEKDLPL